jgi:hypothetical protein
MLLSKVLTEKSNTKKSYNKILLDPDVIDEEQEGSDGAQSSVPENLRPAPSSASSCSAPSPS